MILATRAGLRGFPGFWPGKFGYHQASAGSPEAFPMELTREGLLGSSEAGEQKQLPLSDSQGKGGRGASVVKDKGPLA